VAKRAINIYKESMETFNRPESNIDLEIPEDIRKVLK
jgi:hypothetical protein